MIAGIVQWLAQGQARRLQAGLGRYKQMYDRTGDEYTLGSHVNLSGRGRLRDHCRVMTPSPQLLSLPLEGFFIFIYPDIRR